MQKIYHVVSLSIRNEKETMAKHFLFTWNPHMIHVFLIKIWIITSTVTSTHTKNITTLASLIMWGDKILFFSCCIFGSSQHFLYLNGNYFRTFPFGRRCVSTKKLPLPELFAYTMNFDIYGILIPFTYLQSVCVCFYMGEGEGNNVIEFKLFRVFFCHANEAQKRETTLGENFPSIVLTDGSFCPQSHISANTFYCDEIAQQNECKTDY